MKALLEKLLSEYVATLDDETNVELWNTDRQIASAEVGNFLKSPAVADACNTHEQLVAALKRSTAWCEEHGDTRHQWYHDAKAALAAAGAERDV